MGGAGWGGGGTVPLELMSSGQKKGMRLSLFTVPAVIVPSALDVEGHGAL